MSPLISNDLNSPVSHLWAHQLRREHATIVDQLGELKALHPSAVELKKLVTRTEKAEAATTKFRKEFTELKSAHQKSVKVIEALENELRVKERDREADLAVKLKNEESFRVEIGALDESLRRQEGELANVANDIRKTHGQHAEISAAMEQKLLQKEDEITELRILVQALEQKIGAAVTAIKDSVVCPQTKEAPSVPRDELSEADSFDLDANVQTDTAAPSLSLAMIKEPTLLRCSQRLRDEPQPSMGESMDMLQEPSLPPHPEQLKQPPSRTPQPQPPRSQVLAQKFTKPDINLVQGTSTLSAYMQIAGSRYQETPLEQEERFVSAFVHGLRDKRNRKKCEKRLKEVGKTWKCVRECFPVASQQSQSQGKFKEDVRKTRRFREVETSEARDAILTPPLAKERTEAGMKARPGPHPRLKPGPAKQKNQLGKDDQNAERTRLLPIPAPAPAPAPASAVAVVAGKQGSLTEKDNAQVKNHHRGASPAAKKGALTGQDNGQIENRHDEAPSATKKRTLAEHNEREVETARSGKPPLGKMRRTKKAERRQERPPSIPILPSSDDEYSASRRR